MNGTVPILSSPGCFYPTARSKSFYKDFMCLKALCLKTWMAINVAVPGVAECQQTTTDSPAHQVKYQTQELAI